MGIYADTAERDVKTEIQNFSVKTTLAEANAAAQKLGAKSLGVVPTHRGFALRHHPTDREDVYAALHQAEQNAYGQLTKLTKDDANHYVVRNVDDSITPILLAQRLLDAIK